VRLYVSRNVVCEVQKSLMPELGVEIHGVHQGSVAIEDGGAIRELSNQNFVAGHHFLACSKHSRRVPLGFAYTMGSFSGLF
jgi:hypothetical protein